MVKDYMEYAKFQACQFHANFLLQPLSYSI